MRLLAFVCVLVIEAGCTPDLVIDTGANVLCGRDATCPANLVCVKGQRCVSPEVVDGIGVSPIVPSPDAILSASADVTFAWSTATGAELYTVEVATDPDFANLVGGESAAVRGTSFEQRLPVGTYYWRVASDITSDEVARTVVRFGVLDDAVFVYCPAGADCSESTDGELGTPQLPYRSINSGMAAARRLMIPGVRVASRADDAPYREVIRLLPGLTLSGGYSADFASRAGRTQVARDDVSLYAAVIAEPTRVEHFTFTNTLTIPNSPPASFSNNSTAIRIVGCGEDLELFDVEAVANALTSDVVRVEAGDATSGPLISDSLVSARYGPYRVGRSTKLVALSVSDAAVRLTRAAVSIGPLDAASQGSIVTAVLATGSRLAMDSTTIRASGQDGTTVVAVEGAGAQIVCSRCALVADGNTAFDVSALNVAAGPLRGWAVLNDSHLEASGPQAEAVVVTGTTYFAAHRSTVLARASVANATALDVSGGNVHVASNLLAAAGSQGATHGVYVRGEAVGALINNTVVIGEGAIEQFGVAVDGARLRVVNNAIAGLGSSTCSGFCRVAFLEDNSDASSSLHAFARNTLIGFTPDGANSCPYATGQAYSQCIDVTGNRDALTPHPYFVGNVTIAAIGDASLTAPLGVDNTFATADDDPSPVAPASPLAASGIATDDDSCRPSVSPAELTIPVPACGAVVTNVTSDPVLGGVIELVQTVVTDRDGRPLGAMPPAGAFTPR